MDLRVGMWVDRQASFLPELGIKPVVDQISKQKPIILKGEIAKKFVSDAKKAISTPSDAKGTLPLGSL